eukprot:3702884-Prymnesium_polylepis.1
METLLAIPTMPDLQHVMPAPFGPRGATCTATRDTDAVGVWLLPYAAQQRAHSLAAEHAL